MDNYPQSLLLLAIDDKIWQLGSCGDGGHSIYGNLKETGPYWEAFQDATAIMTAAGVGYDPVSFQMQVVPSRITGGTPEYGPPNLSDRIYPEMLIDRYKVIQQMRYKRASIYDTRRANAYNPDYGSGSIVGAVSDWSPAPYYGDWKMQIQPQPSAADWDVRYNNAAGKVSATYASTLGGLDDLSAMTPSGLAAWWTITTEMLFARQYSYVSWEDPDWFAYATSISIRIEGTNIGPHFKTFGYAGINRDVKLWGEDNGVVRLVWSSLNATGEITYTTDLLSSYGIWPNYETIEGQPGVWTDGRNVVLDYPVEDWKFQFCKHDDNGGAVTWTM